VGSEQNSPVVVSAGIAASVAIHFVGLIIGLLLAARVPVDAPQAMVEFEVALEPPKGVIEGQVDGKGTPLEFPVFKAPPPPKTAPVADKRLEIQDSPDSTDEVKTGKKLDVKDDDKKRPEPKKLTAEEIKAATDEEMREAVKNMMLSSAAVAGTGSAQPLGTPDGKEGGTGPIKKKMDPRWAGMVDGFFSSKMVIRGIGLPWDELKKLSVRATITLTPLGQVTGFSMSSSGNAGYDSAVRSALQSSVGQSVPKPPDGDDIPPTVTLNFRCRSQSSCS
jgi:hypothetical protein